MDSQNSNFFKRHPLILYFTLSFAFTWLILSPGVAANLGLLDFEFDGTALTILGGIGPLLAVIVVTKATEGNAGIRKIFQRMFNWRVKLGNSNANHINFTPDITNHHLYGDCGCVLTLMEVRND